MRQRRGHGRRHGVVGEGERRSSGQSCGIGLARGNGLAALSEPGRGEGPDARGIGGGAAEHGGTFAERHRGVGIGGSGQRIVGGDVVGAGRMRQRRGDGWRASIIGEGHRRSAGQPGGIGLAGGDGLRALRQAGRGEGPDARSIGGGAAENGRAFAERHGGVGIGGSGHRIIGGDVVSAGRMRQRRGDGRRSGVVGEGERRAAGQPGGIGLAGGHGLRTLSQAGRGEGPDARGIGGGGAKHGRTFAQRHGGVGVGGSGQRIVGGEVVGAGRMRQRRGHGRRGGVVGEGERGRAGQPRGIGLAGGDGLAALGKPGRGEGPHTRGIGGGGAKHGRTFAQRHGGVGVGGSGQRIVGGDVVGTGGVGQRRGHGRGGGIVGKGQRRRAGEASGIGLAGGDGLAALSEPSRGEGPHTRSIGGGSAEPGRAFAQRHGGVGVGGAGQRIVGGDVVGTGGVGQRYSHGRGGGIVGKGQRRRAGEASGISLAGGDGLAALSDPSRVKAHTPEALAVAVPSTVEPSLSVTVALASAVPVSASFEVTLLLPVACASATVTTGVLDAVGGS